MSPAEEQGIVAVLAPLLQAEAVAKMLHGGRQDVEALLHQVHVLLVNGTNSQVNLGQMAEGADSMEM